MDLLNKELRNLLGITEPSYHKCIIAIAFDGRAFLIKSDDNIEEVFNDSDLEDNLTDKKQIPKEAGIYKCVIKYHSFKCNISIDPDLSDCTVTIESCELMNLSF